MNKLADASRTLQRRWDRRGQHQVYGANNKNAPNFFFCPFAYAILNGKKTSTTTKFAQLQLRFCTQQSDRLRTGHTVCQNVSKNFFIKT
jgi:hypothetical protein